MLNFVNSFAVHLKLAQLINQLYPNKNLRGKTSDFIIPIPHNLSPSLLPTPRPTPGTPWGGEELTPRELYFPVNVGLYPLSFGLLWLRQKPNLK